jgi:hypothetical protein
MSRVEDVTQSTRMPLENPRVGGPIPQATKTLARMESWFHAGF